MRLLDWSRATILSLTQFEVSWELMGLGETPIQFSLLSPGRTLEERRRIVEGVGEELRARGLGDDRGPHPVLAEQMRLLATAGLELDVRMRTDTLVAGVAAVQRDRCVLAVRHRAEIALLPLHAERAGPALVELFGPSAPGPGRTVTLPADVLDAVRAAAPAGPARFAEELVWRGTDRSDAEALVSMCSDVRRRGQLGATGRRFGTRVRAPYVAGVHETAQGSYRQVRRTVRGLSTVTIGPAGPTALLTDLDELAAATGDRPVRL
jgi:hypothetical protein